MKPERGNLARSKFARRRLDACSDLAVNETVLKRHMSSDKSFKVLDRAALMTHVSN